MNDRYTGIEYSIVTVGGTSAFDIALVIADVNSGDEVITQPLNFVETTNVIHYTDVKHLTRTERLDHYWNNKHYFFGYNYRLLNFNAALISAQLEENDFIIQIKRSLANDYGQFFSHFDIKFRTENESSRANYWLMSIELKNITVRDSFLTYTTNSGIYSRLVSFLLSVLPMYYKCHIGGLVNSIYASERIINIPNNFVN